MGKGNKARLCKTSCKLTHTHRNREGENLTLVLFRIVKGENFLHARLKKNIINKGKCV